jgi:hypothetical protein
VSTEWKALVARSKTTKAKVAILALTAAQSGPPIVICAAQTDLTAKVIGRVEPADGLIVRYARDEALSKVLEIGS